MVFNRQRNSMPSLAPPPPPPTLVQRIMRLIVVEIEIWKFCRNINNCIVVGVKPMAQLIKDYNFGFPLRNVQQLDDIEQNILTDDKYATSLVNN